MTRVRTLPVPLLLLAMLVACDPGSRNVPIEYYNISFSISQGIGGVVLVKGQTDLPAGTRVDALVTIAASVDGAADQAVLVGSTSGPDSFAVRARTDATPGSLDVFQITLSTVVAYTCHLQPPCGPFPAGDYHLLLDIPTPVDSAGGPSSLDDKRFQTHMHGFSGGSGLEIFQPVHLNAISRYIDKDGYQSGPGLSTAPPSSPSP